MPQAPARSSVEQFEFDVMLLHMNWLFLATPVLVLVDLGYLSRFWASTAGLELAPHTLLEPKPTPTHKVA